MIPETSPRRRRDWRATASLTIGLALNFVFLTFAAAEPTYRITLDGGSLDRSHSVVSFDPPPGIHDPVLTDDQQGVAAQLGPDGRVYFVLDRLQSGQSKTLVLKNRSEPRKLTSAVWAIDLHDGIRFELNGKSLLRYQSTPSFLPRAGIDPVYRRSGYIHPIWNPSGGVITDDYPHNHLHHHGLWVAWPNTRFDGRRPNFWEMGKRQGTVEFVTLDRYWSGEVMGGFQSRHRLVDLSAPEPVTVLHEDWTVHVYAIQDPQSPRHVFDLQFVQRCATDQPIQFPQYRYGGLGFRGHGQWDGPENTRFLTGLGETDRIKGHATRAPWCHIGGTVDGHLSGIAILCHPGNFRAPQPMRIHPSEPFFCYAPSQAGDWEIVPGQPYRSRYRFIVQDGEPDESSLKEFWQDYAHPVEVEILQIN